MHDLEKGILSLAVMFGIPILVMLASGGLFALLAFIATAILFIMNLAMVFTRPSRRIAAAFLLWSLLPLVLGLAGSVVGIGGFKFLLFVYEQMGFGKISDNFTAKYIAWFSAAIGALGTAVNLIPAALNYVFSLKNK